MYYYFIKSIHLFQISSSHPTYMNPHFSLIRALFTAKFYYNKLVQYHAVSPLLRPDSILCIIHYATKKQPLVSIPKVGLYTDKN